MRATTGMVLGLGLLLAAGCDDGGGGDGATDTGPAPGMGGAPGAGGAGGTPGAGGEPGMGGAPAADPYGPSARVTQFGVPADATEAANCPGLGTQGQNFASLLALLQTDLQALVDRDEMGLISVVLLLQAEGFPASPFDLNVFLGDEAADGFRVDPRAFVGGDPQNGPQGRLTGFTHAGGTFEGGPISFTYTMPIGTSVVDVRFDAFRARGDIRAEGAGVAMDEAWLAGYLTSDTVESLVQAFRGLCASDDPPSTCTAAATLLENENAADVVVALAGGYDALITGGADAACQGDECNAISVCIRVGADPVTIAGVLP